MLINYGIELNHSTKLGIVMPLILKAVKVVMINNIKLDLRRNMCACKDAIILYAKTVYLSIRKTCVYSALKKPSLHSFLLVNINLCVKTVISHIHQFLITNARYVNRLTENLLEFGMSDLLIINNTEFFF